MENPLCREEKSERKKKKQRGAVMDWLQRPFLIPCSDQDEARRIRSEEMKLRIEKSEEKYLVFFCFPWLKLVIVFFF